MGSSRSDPRLDRAVGDRRIASPEFSKARQTLWQSERSDSLVRQAHRIPRALAFGQDALRQSCVGTAATANEAERVDCRRS
ncbi:unnamed protein product [Brugia timori]|uniref:Histidine kinase n=1 Tax=Brugia timori TaxID=42155 RepID=A0A0R3QCC4_9BILA|nr:unnamed protein product [Brugia timori]